VVRGVLSVKQFQSGGEFEKSEASKFGEHAFHGLGFALVLSKSLYREDRYEVDEYVVF